MQVERSGATTPSLARVIGVRTLAMSCVNLLIGASIFVLPAAVAAILGPAAIVAYLVCAIAILLIALCLAEAGSRITTTGGIYAYVEAAFGPYVGFLAGMLFLVGGQIISSASVAVVLLEAIGALVPSLGTPVARAALAVGLYAGLAAINIRGVKLGARVVEVLTVAKLVPLAVLLVAGIASARSGNLVIPHAPSLSQVGEASLILIFAFMGIEGALSVSGEVKEPARTVPRAILLALLFVTALYGAIQLAAQGILGPALATDQAAPLATATGTVFGAAGRSIVLLGAAISTLGYVAGDMLSSPRLLYAFSCDGMLPSQFARVHPRYQSPHLAIVTYALLACGFALTGSFRALAVLSVVSVLLIYFACALAVLQLRRQKVRTSAAPYVVPGGPLVPVLAMVVVSALLASATRAEFIAVGAFLAIASVLYVVRRSTRSVPATAS